jgi:hypothetical protein
VPGKEWALPVSVICVCGLLLWVQANLPICDSQCAVSRCAGLRVSDHNSLARGYLLRGGSCPP